MLPAETTVSTSVEDVQSTSEAWTVAVVVGEFTKKRIYLSGDKAKHIKLMMSGSTRFMAIESFAVFEQLPDHRSEITSAQLRGYLVDDRLSASTVAAVKHAVPHKSLQLLNLARDALRSYFPHCLAKIDCVTYGLLPPRLDDPETENSTRRFMAIPFTGKDTPAAAAEFSHPDILILLTLLAYRHEGLRPDDLRKVVTMLKNSLKVEKGPLAKRRSYITFQKWLADAHADEGGGAAAAAVLPLELLDANDPRQHELLVRLLRKRRDVISFFVREYVFPECLHHRRHKISATSEELGGEALFRVRLGFSGTPSTLLPVALGDCDFEPGTEGQIARVLCDSSVVTTRRFVGDWSVTLLLTEIANAFPPVHALIDIGALITGLESQEVAHFLLEAGLSTMAGVVYVDQAGQKVVLTRGKSEPVPLEQSSVQPAHRFTFYDQHHTTGVDIKQTPTACAVVTLGKDSVLRDYAQGAWRMRRLGLGQTLRVWLIPEVARLVDRTRESSSPSDISATEVSVEINATMSWLLVNTCRAEKLQAAKLQELKEATVVRTPAIKRLVSIARAAADGVEPCRAAAKAARDEAERALQQLEREQTEALEDLHARLTNERREEGRKRMSARKDEDMRATGRGHMAVATTKQRSAEELEALRRREEVRKDEDGIFEHEAAAKARAEEGAILASFASKKAVMLARQHESGQAQHVIGSQDRVWLRRCMAVLVEPMEFGVAATVGNGHKRRKRPEGYDEAVSSFSGSCSGGSGGSCSGAAAVAAVSEQDDEAAASAVYDNEVQNEKEQEQQQQVQETKPMRVSVYRGGARLEESFNAELLTIYSNAAAMNKLALDAAAADGDGTKEQTETELLLPWYHLSEFAMKDLPCALLCPDTNGTMPSGRRLSLWLSANHTSRTQPQGIPRRLRNVIALLHFISPPAADDDSAAGWLMAVTLAEAQSLMLLLRQPSVLTSAPGSQDAGDGDVRLAILLASDGAVLASTAAYDRRCSHGAFGGGGAALEGARQLMRFFDNAAHFSPAEIESLVPYLQDIDRVQRLRWYAATLRCRRRDRTESDDHKSAGDLAALM